MILSEMMKEYQDNNPEKFNQELLNMKERDSEKKYLEIAMRSLNCIEGITYLCCKEVNHTVYKIKNLDLDNVNISIDRSKLKIYRFFFHIEKDGQEEDISFDLYYPKLIKGQYFLINDNRYFPVYQLLDSSFFNTKKGVVLKTLITPIAMMLKDDYYLELKVFKKEINPLYYYLAKFNLDDTLEFFGIKDDVVFSEIEEDKDDYFKYKINKKFFIYIKKDKYDSNYLLFNTLLTIFNSRSKISKINDQVEWKKKLGSLFTSVTDVSKKIAKAESALVSLERSLDDLNKEIIRLPEEYKKDIYHLLRYMINNYTQLKKRSNCSLNNKRIRSHEYMVYPLFKKFTSFVRRVNNSKNVTFEKLHDFIPSKGILVKYAATNDLLRYDNSCNSIGIITKLRISQAGPQSQFSSGSVNLKYRTNHPSFVGRLDLLATSASSPGANLMLTPFCKIIDDKYFTDEETFESDDE